MKRSAASHAAIAASVGVANISEAPPPVVWHVIPNRLIY